MRINHTQNLNFKAFSTRAAKVMLNGAYNSDKKEEMQKLIIEQAQNSNYHIDFQNYWFRVCKAKSAAYRLNEETSRRDVVFSPLSGSFGSPFAAAQYADRLEMLNKPYQEKEFGNNTILNYTI